MKRDGIIYIESSDTKLKLSNNNLIILKEDNTYEINLDSLEILVIQGNTTITTNILLELLSKGIRIVFLGYYGDYKNSLNPDIKGNVLVRHAQYKISDTMEGFKIGKEMILGKIHNQISILNRQVRNYGSNEIVQKSILEIQKLEEYAKISLGVNQLQGYEGKIAEEYFKSFNELIRNKEFSFNGRSHKPPLDEVNSLLSYGYTLLRIEIEKDIGICGLDPNVGFIHSLRSGKPSLALDLMEEFRFIVDRLVLNIVNQREIDIDNFKKLENGAVYCDEKAREVLIRDWESKKRSEINYNNNKKITYRELMLNQVRLLVRTIKGEDTYKAYKWK